VPVLIIGLIKFLLRDNQRPEPLSGQIVALVLNVASVDRFALLDHDHICAFEVQNDAAGLKVLDDDAHAFGFGGEWEVGQDLVLLLGVVGVENEDFVLLAVTHEEAKLLCEFDQGNFIGT
jgi:hypothetical protein